MVICCESGLYFEYACRGRAAYVHPFYSNLWLLLFVLFIYKNIKDGCWHDYVIYVISWHPQLLVVSFFNSFMLLLEKMGCSCCRYE